jgi:hypothetical protein
MIELVPFLTSRGYPKDDIASQINGSVHTAYFDDLRLARKIVAISLQIYPFVQREGKSPGRDDFDSALIRQLKKCGQQPQPQDYLEVLANLGRELPSWILEKINQGELSVRVLSSEDFEAEDYGLAGAKHHLARFVRANPEKNTPHQIQIRQIPHDIAGPHARTQRMKAFGNGLLAFYHELGHYKLVTGLDEEIKGYLEGPLLMGNRAQVLVSEIIANLEEHPLRTQFLEKEPWVIASRLGENFPLYIRMINEDLYYRTVNEKLMEGLKPLQ